MQHKSILAKVASKNWLTICMRLVTIVRGSSNNVAISATNSLPIFIIDDDMVVAPVDDDVNGIDNGTGDDGEGICAVCVGEDGDTTVAVEPDVASVTPDDGIRAMEIDNGTNAGGAKDDDAVVWIGTEEWDSGNEAVNNGE
jgi:hypothetical protein